MRYLYFFLFLFFVSNFTYAQCLEDRHSPFENQGWQSCNTSVGPVPARGVKHWIAYDFGEEYVVDSLYFWNHNVWGETGMGAKEIMIDYSTDQINWTGIGPFTIEKAPGSWKYEGTSGPILGEINARYILITVMSTWDPSQTCAGLAEVKFILGLPLAIEEAESEAIAWNISPNPASEQILIDLPADLDILNLSLYNSIGSLVSNYNVPTDNQLTVPINKLQSGVYYISYQTEDDIQTKSFVKIK